MQRLNEENYKDLTGLDGFHPPEREKTIEFQNLMIMYPVGRHVAFRSLETHRMKFLKLPNEVHTIQCLTLNNRQDVVAVAVKLWDTDTGLNVMN